MLVRASLFFNTDVMMGEAIPDEAHPELHLRFTASHMPMPHVFSGWITTGCHLRQKNICLKQRTQGTRCYVS